MNRHAIHLQRPDILPSESFRPSTQHIQLYGHQLARLLPLDIFSKPSISSYDLVSKFSHSVRKPACMSKTCFS
jgi:hypothetical protein